MYKFSPIVRIVSIVLIALGFVLYVGGFVMDSKVDKTEIEQRMEENPYLFSVNPDADHHSPEAHAEHEHHMHHLENQAKNKPWVALFVVAFLFTGISMASFFFMCIQHAANAGWSIMVIRIMEGIASFMPYGFVILFAIMLGAYFEGNHIFHWMDESLVEVGGGNFDKFIFSKEPFLNKNFFIVRILLYFGILIPLMYKVKSLTRKLDETADEKDWKNLYNWSVISIVCFGFISMAMGWDFVMSIDPHWYSTLFGWYVMVSYLVSAIAVMIIISVYFKKIGIFDGFNDNHLHDLTKFMFGFSLLWGYLFFCQFMLMWYANIPEEVAYFQARFRMYKWSYLPMLAINILLPLLALMSSGMKRKFMYVATLAVVIIIGHYIDIYHMLYPGSVGPFRGFGLAELGAILFMLGLFTFVVLNQFTKGSLYHKGNPYWHESEIYEYPF